MNALEEYNLTPGRILFTLGLCLHRKKTVQWARAVTSERIAEELGITETQTRTWEQTCHLGHKHEVSETYEETPERVVRATRKVLTRLHGLGLVRPADKRYGLGVVKLTARGREILDEAAVIAEQFVEEAVRDHRTESALLRLRDEILEGRESQTASGRARGASRPSRVFDGEAEAALDPGPLLSVVEELEVEPPRLRVVEP